jgi:release factor glutamine methyltransferase
LEFSSCATIGALVQAGCRALEDVSGSARLDSELLLAHTLSCTRAGLLARLRDPASSEVASCFAEFIQRRQGGEPLAYIVAAREFWGLSFEVSPDVLVPRPETELLVEEGVRRCRGLPAPRIVDLGTGSGCIAIALAVALSAVPDVVPQIVAVDTSRAALALAQRNAVRHNVSHLITWVESDWCTRREAFCPPYDLVVSNPPYLDRAELTPPELSFEPAAALYAADHGWREVRRVCEQGVGLLAPHGALLCEIGAGKRATLAQQGALGGPGWRVTALGDDSALDRFTVLVLDSKPLSG